MDKDLQNVRQAVDDAVAERKRYAAEQTLNAYKHIFRSPDGALVLKDLKRRYGVEGPLVKDISNTNELILREGQRNVVLQILNFIAEEDV